MKIDENTNILIIGLGIIGGSYARGFTKAGYRIHAIDTDEETIEYALKNGIVAEGTTETDRTCDFRPLSSHIQGMDREEPVVF